MGNTHTVSDRLCGLLPGGPSHLPATLLCLRGEQSQLEMASEGRDHRAMEAAGAGLLRQSRTQPRKSARSGETSINSGTAPMSLRYSR